MIATRTGQTVPPVSFRTREGGEWKTVTTDEILKGKTGVGFSLTATLTTTCS